VSTPAALRVAEYHAVSFRRLWRATIGTAFFAPLFYLAGMGLGLGSLINQSASSSASLDGHSYVAFLAPGLVCVAAMNGASFEVTYNIFVRLTFEKQYDAMLTTPIQPDDVLFGEILWAVSRAAVYGTTFFIVVALFGLAPLPRALLMLPVIPLAGLLFAAIGIAFSLRIPTIEVFSFYFTLFLTPLFLFSDVFFPLKERLSGGWLWMAEALPLLHPVRLARFAFGQGGSVLVATWDVTYIAVVATVLLWWARRAVRARLIS